VQVIAVVLPSPERLRLPVGEQGGHDADSEQGVERHLWQRFAEGMTPDVVYEETGTQRRVDGVDAYVQLCQGWRQAFPDVRGAIRTVVASGNTVRQEIIWEGTHTGTLEGPGGPLPPSGRRIHVPASLWITFSGNQGKEVHHHLDVLALLGQPGAIPAP
jgi:predicted ester cyclase